MKSITFIKPNMSLALCAAAISAAFMSYSNTAVAAPSGATLTTGVSGAAGSSEKLHQAEHHQHKAKKAGERGPKMPHAANARSSYGSLATHGPDFLKRPSGLAKNTSTAVLAKGAKGMQGAQAAAAACDANLYTVSGSALLNAVTSSSVACINDLFNLSGAMAGKVFNEAQMVTIADGFKANAASYNGTNSASTLQLVLFLRAGYYVNWYNSADTGVYGAKMKAAIVPAMDAFVNNGNFGLVNDVHGEVLSEFVTLVDSSSENAHFLTPVVKRLLNSYNPSYNVYWWMRGAVNNVFTVLFRAHQNDDFKALIATDTSIVDTLYNFVNANFAQLGGDNEYLVSNAGRELGRFLQYADTSAAKIAAKPKAKLMIDRSNVTGTTASLWVGVGEMIDYFDKPNCSYYNLCDFVARLDKEVLPKAKSCSPTLRLRAQALTDAQMTEACNIVGAEEGYFHKMVASGNIPVAKDNNTQLEMVVFNSSFDYQRYAGAIYGIDTNNGGMYLEGSPEVVGNQPRFIAYQAEWMLPKFEIWNLTHEYIHYLDGRFDMYGDFDLGMSVKSTWWTEGFAEYVSYSYRNLADTGAQTEAAKATFPLSTIFQNDYSVGQTRVYYWGYLAVRYMFEKQRNKVSNLLAYFRPGNYSGYTSYMNGSAMGSSMDADFKAWLPCVNNATLPGCPTGTGGNALPVANFSSSVSNMAANFVDASTDSDGSIASRVWDFGDGSSSSLANPSHVYATAKTYTVSLTVTDNSGGKSVVSKSVVIVGGTPVNVLPVAQFGNVVSGMTVAFTDKSTDSDGVIASRAWTFGDGTSSSAANPSKTYAAAGTYPVTLTVTDNSGGKATISQSIVIQAGTTLPECPGTAQALGKNCVRSNVSAPLGDYSYMYLYVPAGTKQVRITTSGGTGNADLFVSTLGTWATRDYYNYGSYAVGNTEAVTVNNPPSGYMYVSLYGQSAFSGVKVKVEY
ncbi:collagenase [Undibacterium parvum]|uniref:microbial collagenase n=1 Tax=Undibacterium parvum TaxID=401471 RepID=A0A3S9HNT7_9BURK|nr:collagenase [Undibacterium parvum]AZP13771.1 PKD domain-containing protein [Undibacterium parvum]